ncbi:IS30 family transposase, partial [Amycolatopsis rubida]|nr:IS30 family transposase [Amycolatopsis rubida]MYW96665.1 IS30 family transposase [Amycolatopsis rubida]MYW96925.1 IS30 family transposase [Amycolatopsis rubida]NEC54610.1 IS30 family transposase [Amycolatopsis rubida]NEC61649.1 IS30 family transposase [Amycolatopsis rubida]
MQRLSCAGVAVFEVGRERASRGRVRLAAERRRYFDLVADGVGTVEACRRVGVDRRTGHYWRHGRPSRARANAAPRRSRPEPGPGRFLTVDERIAIADGLAAGRSRRAIAAELGRSPSTVAREIARNARPRGEYRPHAAHDLARARRPRPKPGKIAASPELRERVQAMLHEKFSPEQIAARLRRDHPDRPELHVTHETIYQALYVQGRGELRRELARALRTGRTTRTPRASGEQRRPRFAEPMVMISDRPAEADDRAVPGHWEGDLIIGKDNASAIATLVERATRYTLLVPLPHGRGADAVRDALAAATATLPAHLQRSLTWDQGSEMGRHHEFTIATGIPVYFCDPHSPWQRGSNENTNGLLRQYFPKSTDLSAHTPEHLAAVAAQLNRRPRKTLNWDT